jgi:hypothetical protein
LPRFLPRRAGLAPDLSFPFPAFVLLSSNQQACTRLFIHHVYGFLRFGVWNRFLDFRSTHLHPLSQDMLLSNGFAGVPGVRRWSSPSPPSHGRWRVLSTRQKAHGLNRRVELLTAPSSTFRINPGWFRPILPLPIAERPSLGGAWFSRASWDGSHTASSAIFAAAVFVFVCLFFWAFLLYPSLPVYPYFGVWVFVTQCTYEIIFNGDPGFVASVPQANGPASSEALPPRTFIHSLYFGLPKPFCTCVFYFLL